jgi:CheY-like chemotaxis protein
MTVNTDKKLILVVEDEPDEASYLTALFEDNGYATATAPDGSQAMARARKRKPDLITLDMSMPEKSGVKLYRELREDPELASVPVLVVTGVAGHGRKAEDFEKFLSSRKEVPPPEGFVAKPIDRNKLLESVSRLLA